jgi:hypothetical protein
VVNWETGSVESRVARVGTIDKDFGRGSVVTDRSVLFSSYSNVESYRTSVSDRDDGVDVKGFTGDIFEGSVGRSRRRVLTGRRRVLTESSVENGSVKLFELVDGFLVELKLAVRNLTEGESARDSVGGAPRRSGNVLTVPPIYRETKRD